MSYLKGCCRLLTATLVALGSLPVAARAQSAVHADRPPVIDGRDDDVVWQRTALITGFQMFDPVEDGEATFRTDARIAYDARNIYVFVRAHDPAPDSLLSLLSRRDVRTSSDHVKIMIDSYFDHRTGFEFAVNPAGVKRDYHIYDDTREDISWDGVWDVQTKVDSLGWTAEFRIPLSQLRYASADVNTMGFMIMRDVARRNERYSWPGYKRSENGLVSQFARVDGFRDLSSPRRVELLPYAVTRNRADADGRAQEQEFGGDARVGLGPNLTLTAAFNPDFGQVEADPAVLNLSAFEVSFDELRPFFVEGQGFFGGNQTLFYSRRIGANDKPIDAAMKVTGRLPGGYTIGGLSAVSDEQVYSLGRVAKDFRAGASGISLLATVVDRNLDETTRNVLRERAYAAGLEGRHRFLGNTYEARASLFASRVEGSEAAIARTQRSSTHSFHRVDSPLTYDSTRTSLSGAQLTASFEKVAGAVRYAASYQHTGPEFETNDLGFLSRADRRIANAYASIRSTKPKAFWNNAGAVFDAHFEYTADGLPIYNFVQAQGFAQFRNNVGLTVTSWIDNPVPAYCDRCARGGPAVRMSPSASVLVNLQADTRKKVVPYFAAIYTTADGGRSYLYRIRPLVAVRSGARLNWEFAARYQKNHDNTQWVGNAGLVGADTTHYIFGHLNQDLLSFQARLNYTLTPALSLQFHAEPFVSTGHYSDLRELSATPRAADYDARFRPASVALSDADFNVKQFSSSTVVRWEYRPGSSLYLVWQQGRAQDDRDAGAFDARRDYANLFGTRPENTILIKASYWLNL